MLLSNRHPFRSALQISLLLSLLATPPALGAAPAGHAAPEPVGGPDGYAVRPSESPHLRPPDALKDAQPIQPYQGPPGPLPADPTATASYSMTTGEATVTPSPAGTEGAPAVGVSPPFGGLALPVATQAPAGGLLREGSVIGFDDRTRISPAGYFPWRSVVKLAIRWVQGGGVGGCSGAMISDYHVLTAGHCVFDYGGTGDWAYSIQVFPGLDDDEAPYNYAWATRLHSYTGWTQSGMTQHDWAVIALDRRVGSFTGWMGRLTEDSSSGTYTGVLNAAGYPGTPDGNATCPSWAACQYWDSDSGHSADEFNHWYWMDTSGGMSGGPVWVFYSDTDDRYVTTTHTCGTGGCGIPSNNVNYGTRLNQDKFDRIPTWIGSDADIAPVDRPDLIDDGQSFSGFTPQTVYADQSFSAWSDVRNVGTASSGSFTVSYYASTNTTITTADHLLGDASTSSILPFTWGDSNLDVNFPAGIPDGSYWIGWIIDRPNGLAELDEGNNTAYKTLYQLEVCNKTGPPSLLSPANSATTTDSTPTFDWTDAAGAASYVVEVDDNSTFSSPVIGIATASSTYTPSSGLSPDTYYWRVRADKACGTAGNWSTVRSFVVTASPSTSCDGVQISGTIGSPATYGACRHLAAGPSLTISGAGDATLEAGALVSLHDGFRVESGGRLTVRTCGHSLCSSGQLLAQSCHSCVAAICQVDSFCCETEWDSQCIAEVGSVCGLTCP